MTKLYVLDGPDKGLSFDLEGDTIHIERSSDNHIRLKDTYVSRKHLRIFRRGEKHFVKDLESKNGTFVDGVPISPGIESGLKEGIPIIIGISVICLGEGCPEEVKAFQDSMDVSKVSKEISEIDAGISLGTIQGTGIYHNNILETSTLPREGVMSPQKKLYLLATLFLIICLIYLLLLFLFPNSSLAQVASVFQSVWANLTVLFISFLLIAFGLSELTDFFYRKSLRMRWRRTKLGEILVSKGYLTEGELKEALSEQRLRIGEVLLQAGRITAQQLDQALNYQKKVSRKLGEILRELGHATEEDINWALNRMDRKLGRILRGKGLLTDREVHRLLALQRYGPR